MVEDAAAAFSISEFQIFSDTVFAACDESRFVDLVRFSRRLLEDGLKHNLPVRGAISHGEFSWGAVTFGHPVIVAHILESAQEWCGISVVLGPPIPPEAYSERYLSVYPIPLKRGQVTLNPAVIWSIPDFNSLVQSFLGGGQTKEGDAIQHAVSSKITNTMIFKLYLFEISRRDLPFDLFYGFSPLQILEERVIGT